MFSSKRFILIAISFIASALFFGCGSGGSGVSIPSNTAAYVSGGLVEGIPYNCGGVTGATDDNGSFNIVQGQGCTFSLGNFSVSVPASALSDNGVATPYEVSQNPQIATSVTSDGATSAQAIANIAYILSAVSDYNSDYTMKINPALAAKLPAIDLNASEAEVNKALFAAGLMPKPRSEVMNDLANYVNPDGSLVYTRKELVTLANNQYVRKFPNVAKAFNMSEGQFKAYVGDGLPTTSCSQNAKDQITQENIKNMSLGSVVNQSCSTFQVNPVLDLGALNSESLIANNQAGSTSVSSISITANQEANSSMDQTSQDYKAATSIMGFTAAAAYHQENKNSATKDSGSTTLGMSYSTQGAYVQITTRVNGGEYYNLSSYLMGKELSASQIDQYVTVTKSTYKAKDGDVNYITVSTKKHGYIPYSQPNVYYQNIQLLSRMEAVFGDLQAQYDNPGTSDKDDAAYIKNLTRQQMLALRADINYAIRAFYAASGDSFVDTINLMNMAIGKGTLNFDSKTGNREAQYAATISSGYSGIVAGVSGQASHAFQTQDGWAKSFAQTNVSAQSWPAGIVDTNSWTATITSMLKAATATLSVPGVTLPAQPTLSTLSASTAKDPNTPPDSVFGSYEEWKKYQDGKKKVGKKTEENVAADAQQKVEQNGLFNGAEELLVPYDLPLLTAKVCQA